jgi:hypothetical protein
MKNIVRYAILAAVACGGAYMVYDIANTAIRRSQAQSALTADEQAWVEAAKTKCAGDAGILTVQSKASGKPLGILCRRDRNDIRNMSGLYALQPDAVLFTGEYRLVAYVGMRVELDYNKLRPIPGARPLDLETSGAEVLAVTPGGPADQAGIKAGDLIIGYNGAGLASALGGWFDNQLLTVPPGSRVYFKIYRLGSKQNIPVILGSRSPVSTGRGNL